MMCSLLNFGQIVVKASTPQEEDNAPVRIITAKTFKNCLSLKKITIPESTYAIKKGAFSGCKAKIKKGKATITVKLRTSGKAYKIKVRVTK